VVTVSGCRKSLITNQLLMLHQLHISRQNKLLVRSTSPAWTKFQKSLIIYDRLLTSNDGYLLHTKANL
jgi:hypothetical protein